MIFTQEHEELRRTVRNFIDREINPHVEYWEEKGRFPIHDIFKKAGALWAYWASLNRKNLTA